MIAVFASGHVAEVAAPEGARTVLAFDPDSPPPGLRETPLPHVRATVALRVRTLVHGARCPKRGGLALRVALAEGVTTDQALAAVEQLGRHCPDCWPTLLPP